MEKDYNKTLNLPKTEFPMRGNLPEKNQRCSKIGNRKKFIIK